MSLRAVRSPLAPKMTMEHGVAGLRDSPGPGAEVLIPVVASGEHG